VFAGGMCTLRRYVLATEFSWLHMADAKLCWVAGVTSAEAHVTGTPTLVLLPVLSIQF
jgi:hypothetical protein